MEITIIALVIIIAFSALGMIETYKSNRKKRRLEDLPFPNNLGVLKENILQNVQRLHSTLPSAYEANVKYRFMQEHPKVKDYEYDWVFFELKRYFIMNSVLKSVPMFSPRVDDIWHEMLMFTRDYDKFSKDFYGEVLHHTPNMEVTPIPGERGFFDWVYLSLFESTPNSRKIWGGFLKNPIEPEIIDDFKQLSEKELLDKYFRKNKDYLDVKMGLIQKLKNEIVSSEKMMASNNKPTPYTRSLSESQMFHLATSAAVFYSLYNQDNFQAEMNDVLPNEYYKVAASGSGSGCSGFACSSGSDDHSGGDSGGSSCSSCGGGCSS